ncbi:ABC transporter ATP-binding protein [Nocardia jinanensis]|nr:ABC transporter ATP-binding protein [Nocardia jinanensis]
MGRITGLIGPNGAGKTTTFNACTGLVRPAAGRIRLHGRDVTDRGPAVRGRLGLGRTFQHIELGDSLTVQQNVGLGREAAIGGANPLWQLLSRPADRVQIATATRRALALCGLEHLADRLAGELSTGDRRLVELARCLAGRFDVLLLDEPSAGLDRAERARFARLLREINEVRGDAILLVEHDMSLVMELCDYIYVLDFGELIFEGTPEQVRDSPVVQAAYLGTDAAPALPRALPVEADHG